MIKESSLMYQERNVRSPADGYKLFKQFLGELDREYMAVIWSGYQKSTNRADSGFHRQLNAAIVHPREIYKILILSNSSSCIICHNHPSGIPEPSSEDIEVTKRISGRMLDHLVNGHDSLVSLKEKGYV